MKNNILSTTFNFKDQIVRVQGTPDNPLFCLADVCKVLVLSNPSKVASQVKDEFGIPNLKLGMVTRPDGSSIQATFITEPQLYFVMMRSRSELAKTFRQWIVHDVLPSIRKTGRYSTKCINENELKIRECEAQAKLANAKARQQNAQTKQAAMWLKLRELTNIKEYKAIAESYAGNTLAGAYVLSLPKAEEKTYSATEIGNIIGVSANKVGMIANANNLKTEEYGKIFYDKSRYSNKEVETFRYYEKVIPLMRELINTR